ncbi:MAG: hypothetical protein GY874_03390 [Desulfobacteraceae bacterium]|nr:hypothetical protein [Desulfobacteraceae bacterium]
MKKRVVVLFGMMLLVFCGICSADDNVTILQEKVELTIEFPLTSRDASKNATAKAICEEKAEWISEQREGTHVKNLEAAVIDVDEQSQISKLNCSFELEYGESCGCRGQICGDGTEVNSCSANCDNGETANCDCGSCDGLRHSTCRCW